MYIADGGPGRTFFPISRGHESKRLKCWHGWSGRAHGIAECFPGERTKHDPKQIYDARKPHPAEEEEEEPYLKLNAHGVGILAITLVQIV